MEHNAAIQDDDLFPETEEEDGTEVEILSEQAEEGVITEPFDPTQIRVVNKPSTIDLIVSRMKHQELILFPDYQRKVVWNSQAQSRLIESLLIMIPLPAFYFDASNDEKWVVVDGLQRLTALKLFIVDETLRLTGLEYLKELEDKHFTELPRNLQRRILEAQVTVYLIEKGTPPKVLFNIFKRINTGGKPLSSQEIRHALNQGPAVTLLKELAESAEFRKATSNGVKDVRMGARECVLRFLAFTITDYREYKEDMETFLNEAMAKINKMSVEERQSLARRFRRAMNAAYAIFGDKAFRKQSLDGGRTNPPNKALFETWAVCLDRLTDEQLEKVINDRSNLRNNFARALQQVKQYEASISLGTGDSAKVKVRFFVTDTLLEGVIK